MPDSFFCACSVIVHSIVTVSFFLEKHYIPQYHHSCAYPDSFGKIGFGPKSGFKINVGFGPVSGFLLRDRAGFELQNETRLQIWRALDQTVLR